MALRNMTQTESTAQFEEEGEVEQAQQDAGVKETAAPPPAPSQQRAVAQVNEKALAIKNGINESSLMALKDAFHVEWNTVERILAASGQFKFKDNDHKLGEEIEVILMSWQDRWVCSPNAKEAETDSVRYSGDGVTATDGTDLKEHLASLKAEGWKNARIDQRLVIMGELVAESGKSESGRLESLVQLDLPPTGAGAFKSYMLQAAYQVSKGKRTFEDSKRMKLKAVGATNKGGDEFTKIEFSL